MEDKEAISRIKQGDLNGLEELINRYQERAVYSAYLILQEKLLAEEVAQNCFVKVVEKIDTFDDSRPFAPWFFRIIVNDSIKIIRQHRRLERLIEEPDGETRALANLLVDPDPLPEHQLEIKEDQEKIHQAMDLLNVEQRAVVVMRYYLQMPENEMSLRLNQPLSTVKWWLRVARKRLKLSLKTEDIKDQL